MEQWRPIPGYPDYAASDCGRIKSVGRWMSHHRWGTQMWWKEKILRPARARGGYLFVVVGKKRNRFVHSLVCLAWHGPRPFAKAKALHWDDIRTHNAATNLRWGTQSQNVRDAARNGKFIGGFRPAGSRHVGGGVFQ